MYQLIDHSVGDLAKVVEASRRDMLAQTAGALGLVAAGAAPALADGAVSAATVQRARGIYGARIQGLADAVAKGDTAAVVAEKNAFILFVSGGYKMSTKEVSLGDYHSVLCAWGR